MVRSNANLYARVIQVQDRRYRENAADLAAGRRPRIDPADEQELDGDLQRKQKVHEEALHGHEASDTPHTRRQHPSRQDVAWRDVYVSDIVLRHLGDDNDADSTRTGTTGVEETGIDLQRAERSGGILLNYSRLTYRIEIRD